MFDRRIITGVLAVVLLVAAAYGIEYGAKSRGMHTATIIKMLNNNQVAALLGVNVLRQLDAGGPSLLAVLDAAGVGNFSGLEIRGLKSSIPYRLARQEINQDLRLMFTERGTVNLCKEQKETVLVEDVSEINAIN